MNIKPFFARFLDVQKSAATNSKLEMKTMKYPSDSDTFDPSDRGYAVKLKPFSEAVRDPGYAVTLKPVGEALRDPGYAVTFRPVAPYLAESSLKEAKDCTPAKPGDIVTLAYPSDSDAIGGRLYF
jgi:hypothetical protein